jgi:hypothetical protein
LEDDIKMDLREVPCEGMVKDLQVLQKVGNFLTRLAAVKFVMKTASWSYCSNSHK